MAGASAGDTVIHVDFPDTFAKGDEIEIAGGGLSERRVILDFGSIVVDKGLEHSYPANAEVTKTMGAEDLQELKAAAGQAAQAEKKKRDAIIGGTVGGVVGVAGLVAGLAAGLTANHKPTNTTTEPPRLTWTTLTQATTTQDAIAFMSDAPARQDRDTTLGSAIGHSTSQAGVQEPGHQPWLWLIISVALIVILSLALFCFFRRKLTMAAAKGRRRKQARMLAGDWSPSTGGSRSPSALSQLDLDQSSLDQSSLDQSTLDESALDESTVVVEADVQKAPTCGDARKAWDKLFDILDRDGDGRVTHEDFRHAPVAAVAMNMALEARLEGSPQPTPRSLMTSQQPPRPISREATQGRPPLAGYPEPVEPVAGHLCQPPRPGQALPGMRPGQVPGLPALAGMAGPVPGSFVAPGMAPMGMGSAPPPIGAQAPTPPRGTFGGPAHPAGLRH